MKTMEQRLHSYEPLFGGWTLQGEIGAGSYARVYRVVHRDPFGMVLESALKAVEILPEGQLAGEANLEALVREQYINEVNLLGQLRGISNIVSYEDHAIREIRDNGKLVGYDLLIRMELLTSLPEAMRRNGALLQKEEEIRRIGMDLCRGLSRCHRVGILHRDIKPKNIFVNRFGDYKLGDFGIAHHLEGTMYARTRIGTRLYAAPEITDADSAKYDARADLYSLGLVLYELSNHGMLPFMKPDMNTAERENCVTRRNRGEQLPLPDGVSEAFGRAVVKACAFRRQDRYANAQEMYHAVNRAGKASVPARKTSDVPAKPTEVPETLMDRLWRQAGLSVVLSADARYMKRKLEQEEEQPKEKKPPQKKIYDVLESEQSQKLPPRRMRTSGRLVIDNYREVANWAFRGRKDLLSLSCSGAAEKIGEEAFADCTSLQELQLGEPLRVIGPAAFQRCTKLEQCILPDSVEEIGERAFQDCTALKTAVIPPQVTELPGQLFSGCKALNNVQLSDSVSRIGAEAFRGCTEITRFTLPARTVWMGPRTFSGCRLLQEVALPAQLASLPQGCFRDCSTLHAVRFAFGLREIEQRAFYRCSGLHELELPFGLEKIGAEAFAECENLTYITVPESVSSIGEQAFGSGGSRFLFGHASRVTVQTPRGSYAWNYCRQYGIRVQEP